ncbi:hypothetical protein KUL113_51080 [Tenacibaculum sp. KUL113]|nr:hypothetical protein KUL113_51080 [Tenacibaculum sp. KUL113]
MQFLSSLKVAVSYYWTVTFMFLTSNVTGIAAIAVKRKKFHTGFAGSLVMTAIFSFALFLTGYFADERSSLLALVTTFSVCFVILAGASFVMLQGDALKESAQYLSKNITWSREYLRTGVGKVAENAQVIYEIQQLGYLVFLLPPFLLDVVSGSFDLGVEASLLTFFTFGLFLFGLVCLAFLAFNGKALYREFTLPKPLNVKWEEFVDVYSISYKARELLLLDRIHTVIIMTIAFIPAMLIFNPGMSMSRVVVVTIAFGFVVAILLGGVLFTLGQSRHLAATESLIRRANSGISETDISQHINQLKDTFPLIPWKGLSKAFLGVLITGVFAYMFRQQLSAAIVS